MWNRLKHIGSLPRISLHYISSNQEDADFLKDSLEKYYACTVHCISWNERNSFLDAIQTDLAQKSRLILFLLSDALLEALKKFDEQRDGGVKEHDELLESLLNPSELKKGKQPWRAVVLSRSAFSRRLEKEAGQRPNCHICDPGREEDIPGLINWISFPGLSLRPNVKSVPIDPVTLNNDEHRSNQQTSPLDPSLPTTGNHDMWDGPKKGPEYDKDPNFLPGPVLPDRRSKAISAKDEDVFSHIYETFMNRPMYRGCLILCGAPGAGKTALAVHYMHEYRQKKRDRFYYRNVIWRDKNDTSTEFALDYTLRQKIKDIEQGLTQEQRWLLVMDGCNHKDLEVIRGQLSLLSDKGDILIIMNSTPPPNNDLYTLRLLPLEKKYAEQLLQRSARDATKDYTSNKYETIAKIVRDLYYHPLAIKSAGYSLNRRLRNSNGEVEYGNFSDSYARDSTLQAFGDYKEELKKSFAAFSKELENEDQQKILLLLYCLFFAQNPLPEQLIREVIKHVLMKGKASPEEEKRHLDEFKDIVYRFSLQKENRAYPGEDTELLSTVQLEGMEPLITLQPIIVRQANDFLENEFLEEEESSENDEELQALFVRALSLALPRAKWDRYATWPAYLPHVYRRISIINKLRIENSIDVVRLLYMAGSFLREHPLPEQSPHYMAADELLHLAFNMRKELPVERVKEGEDYPDLSTCESAIAELEHERLLDCTQEAEFKELSEKLLKRYATILSAVESRPLNARPSTMRGFQNVDEVTTYNNLGRLYDDCGEYEKAGKQFTEALKRLEAQANLQRKDSLEMRLLKCEIMNNEALVLMKEAIIKEEKEGDLSPGAKEEENVKNKLREIQNIINIIKRDRNNNEFMKNFMQQKTMTEKEKEAMLSAYQKRAERCETQCKLNKIYVNMYFNDKSISDAISYKDLKEAVEEAERAVDDTAWFDIPARDEYLCLLKRLNNLAEFHRISALNSSNRGVKLDEEKKALDLYKKIRDHIMPKRHPKYGTEMFIVVPYYFEKALVDTLQTLIEQAREDGYRDLSEYEQVANDIERMFSWIRERGTAAV